MKALRRSLAAALVFIGFSSVAAALDLKDLSPPASYPPLTSPYYTIEPKLLFSKEPGFLKFRVKAPHASYDVEGLVPLKKLLHEIEVIERFSASQAGSGFKEGVEDSVRDTGEGFARLVSEPVDSIKGMGRATAKIGRSFGRMFRRKEKGEQSGFGEQMLGGSERDVAEKLGVDVYTTNPHLRRLITSTARSRMGGQGAVAVVKFFLPVTYVVSMTVTASGINSAADRLVNDTDRTELFRLNRIALDKLGFSRADILLFLNVPHFSPREATYLRFYLEKLQNVEGYREIFRRAMKAGSLVEARKILYEAGIVAGAGEEGARFSRIECSDEGMAVEEQGKIIWVSPYDYLDESDLGKKILERIRKLKERWSAKTAMLWNAGKVDPAFGRRLQAAGLTVREWLIR
jgi:hypothetical protein